MRTALIVLAELAVFLLFVLGMFAVLIVLASAR